MNIHDSLPIQAFELRCDGANDPLGIDAPQPRLSWKLRSGLRGMRQSAWRVLVATSQASLNVDHGDKWDSGRVAGEDQLRIPYGGAALRTAEQVFWKVQVWGTDGIVSGWSEVATWTMGVLTEPEWQGRWITDGALLPWRRSRIGFSSRTTSDENAVKWVQLDLGRPCEIEAVRIHAMTHTVLEFLGWPKLFKVEAANDAEFSRPTMLADHTGIPFPNPVAVMIEFPGAGVVTRYVRLTATRLRMVKEDGPQDVGRLALSQIEVLSGGNNIAARAMVTASDSIEEGPWLSAAVVDGLGVPGSNPRSNGTLLVRREFTVRPGLRRALVQVCGLGHYTLAVNGSTPGRDLLTPGWTAYEKTCLYDTHDITASLAPGANAIGVTLANGFHSVQQGLGRYMKFVSAYRPPVVIGQIRFEYDGGVVEIIGTDAAWKVAAGPVTYANIYGGEDYDATREPIGWDRAGFNEHRWKPAAESVGPGGKLRGASFAAPPLRTHETLKPVSVKTVRPGVEVYDLGQNASLMPWLRVRGARGAHVKIVPAELLKPDGSVDRGSVSGSHGATYYGGPESSWNYTLGGSGGIEEWRPAFFYHGSRYLQVERTAPAGQELPTVESIEGMVVHSDSPPVGEFACSSDLFNRTRLLIRWAQRSNLAHVITDCPHRERLSWLEQYHLNGPALRYEFDLTRLYAKTFEDMVDAQQAGGLVPDIAPEYVKFNEGFRDSPEWGSALILAGWQQFVWTGDDAPLRRHYPAMKRYLDHLTRRSNNHILSHGLGDWYDLGPGKPGKSQLTPVPLTATAFYHACADTVAQIARHLKLEEEAGYYAAIAEEIGRAFNREFFDAGKNRYATGSQTAHALPLVLGLVPPEHRGAVLEGIVQDVRARGNGITSGDVGYRYLIRALAAGGRSDVIHAMNHQSEKPGYGYQLACGATSLTEAWNADPGSSQNHFMLGQIMEWFYADLAGIAPDPSMPGFKRVIIRPQPVGNITWAKARHVSPRGPVTVAWRIESAGFVLEIEVPPNVTAEVGIPTGDVSGVMVDGRPVVSTAGITPLPAETGCAIFAVESGRYSFSAALVS